MERNDVATFDLKNMKAIQQVLKDEEKRNKEINKMIDEDRQLKRKEVILLLLGTGESGKSTVAKQLRIINQKTWTDEERVEYKPLIYRNIISSMQIIISNANKANVVFDASNEDAIKYVLSLSETAEVNSDFVNRVEKLLQDPQFKIATELPATVRLDSAPYYFSELVRIGKPDWMPTDQDILRSRQRTTGIVETDFTVDGINFRLVDVGGQRTERKKWIHCFEGVTSMIFCTDMSAYGTMLEEDDKVDRMHESLNLFEEIVNNKWFFKTDVILFLNKSDLFQEKIKTTPLNVCFSEYTTDPDPEAGTEFIKKQFVRRNKNPDRMIYPHSTTATDTNNITVVFKAVKGIILHNALSRSGLM
jgi:GTPase SAR1 family protein